MTFSQFLVCRLCMYQCGEDRSNMIHIFTHPLLAAKISYVTDLQVTECDGLPSVICQRCSLRLNSAESFKRLSHSSDESLRSQFIHLGSSIICEPTFLVEVQLESEVLDEKPDYEAEYDTELHNQLEVEDNLSQVTAAGVDFSDISVIVKEEESGEIMSPFYLDLHEVEDIERSKYICETCGKHLANSRNLCEHRRYVHQNQRPFKCATCGRGFNTRTHLKRHSLRHTRVKPTRHRHPKNPSVVSACGICDKVFLTASGRAAHRRNVHSSKIHQCQICQLIFSKRTQLKNHRSVHSTGSGAHTCGTCGKSFSIALALLSHLKSHRSKEKYACGQCAREFSSQSQLVTHSVSHSTLRPFECNICQARFKSKSYLMEHSSVHTSCKDYLCSYCGKGFRKKSLLTRHHSVHTGERPFLCGQCGKRFKYKTSLTMHKKRHAGDRTYVCDTCGSSFLTMAVLTRHKRTHTGERPHVCTVCSRGFGRSEHLATHMLIHTGERMYHCDDCQKTFVYKVALVNHYKKSCRKTQS